MEQNNSFFKRFLELPRGVAWLFAAYILFGFNVCLILEYSWANRMDYSFGYLAPVFALFVIYDRRNEIFKYFAQPSVLAVEIPKKNFVNWLVDIFFCASFLGGMGLYFVFALVYFVTLNRGASGFGMTIGFAAMSFAFAYFASCYGKNKTLKEKLNFTFLFTFSSLILIVSAPIFNVIEELISLFLLSKVAVVVLTVMDFFGYVVELKGNTIMFPNGSVGVADACSGIRSLTACLFAGSFLAAVFLDKFWKKVLLVFLSMVCAFFNNLLRALFLSFWAYEYGPDSISGFVHDAAGYFVLILTVIDLLILLPLFSLNPVPPELRNVKQDDDDQSDETDSSNE